MAEEWVTLTGGEELKPDDVVRVWSEVIGAGKLPTQLQIEKVCRDVERQDPRFRVEGYSYPDSTTRSFFIKVRIIEPTPAQQRAGVGAYVIAGLVGAAVTSSVIAITGAWTASKMQGRVMGTAEGLKTTAEKGLLAVGGWAAAAVVGYIAIKALNRKGG